jgi:hypothetical protein
MLSASCCIPHPVIRPLSSPSLQQLTIILKKHDHRQYFIP